MAVAERLRQIAPEPLDVPAEDRVPDELAGGTPEELRRELTGLLGKDRVLSRVSDLVRYASDASPYRRIPKAVVIAHDAEDVAKLLAHSRQTGLPITFRSGGTSLNGQAQSDSVLVDVRRHWRGVDVLDGGERVRVRPGTVLGHVNRRLAKFGRKLGPDPASTDFATVGGVIANNSGGMRCGVERDSYRTVRALSFILPSGTRIDSAAPDAEQLFAEAEPELAKGLLQIRKEILADPELTDRIRRKFEIKNTTGYRLCAFLDGETPLEIFRRLLVGSEGTLAFTTEAEFETVPVPPRTTLAWLHFVDIDAACEPVNDLIAAGATAVELMVAPALLVAAHNIPNTPEYWKELAPESAALLVEFGGADEAELEQHEAAAAAVIESRELIRPHEFTRDREVIDLFWHVREGMLGLIGSIRPQGTALIIEDVCVTPSRIAESAKDIQALLGKHGFLTGVAGHTSAGNLHFTLTPDFTVQEDRDRYEAFMGELVELIVGRYDGSLKAEHGTGLNMAPFVEREWGKPATELMWRIKRLADPDGVLSPGVILNEDPGVHLRDLKSQPPVEEVATTCVECGFCEPVCPSRDLTTTPRQRIVLRREMARQEQGSPVWEALLSEYEYDSIETCAADGSCMLACPVGIDTGKLVKDLRERQHSEREEKRALRTAKRWRTVERLSRAGLRGGALARGSKRFRALPRAAKGRLPETAREGAAAVYLPSCINRIFGGSRKERRTLSLPEALVALSERAGQPLWIPDDVPGHCCAVPWSSKGYSRAHEFMAEKTADALWRWSGEGELPIVIDASSCAHGLRTDVSEHHDGLEVLDSIAWVHDRLLPNLQIDRKLDSVAVHPTCSARHLGLTRQLEAMAAAIAGEVTTPAEATCCGFAGDRGFLFPELTASATAPEAAELATAATAKGTRGHAAHISSNRTCELALERATGAPYTSFIHPLEELTRP